MYLFPTEDTIETHKRALKMNEKKIKTQEVANLLRRLMAMLYDSLLLIGIIFAFGLVVLLLRLLAGEDTMQAPSNILQGFIMLGMWLSCTSFYVWCWHRKGQTLGMKSWRLHVQDVKQKKLTWEKCFSRCILAHISLGFMGLGYIWCLIDKEGRCLHDIFSNTKVIVTDKQVEV